MLREERGSYVETCPALLCDHVIATALAVLIASTNVVGGVLRFLSGLDEVVCWDVGFGRAT